VGSSFFPIQDRSEFLVRMEMPPGTSLSYMREKSEEAARVARTFEDVLYSFTTVGGVGGTVDSAEMYVRLVPKADRDRHQDDIAADVAREVRRLAGLEVAVTGTGFRNEKQIQVQLTGPDIGVLSRLADALAERVRDVPGAVDVGLSTGRQKPELSVELDRELASRLGLTVGSVAQALRPAFAGLDVGDWVDPEGDTRDVVVRLAGDARTRREHLADLPVAVPGPTGSVVLPLSAIASVTQGLGPAEIAHSDRERVIAVEANARGLPLSAVLEGIDAILAEVPMPPGYAVVQGGEAERQGDVFGRMLASLGVALVMMYFVLVVQYGSFLTPVPILMSLPLSLVGVMLGLWVTGQTVNLMSMIGIVLLMGIVAKNAILLIDFARSAEDAGVPRREALIEAGGMRLRPILMTSVAIVAGMIPVAVGGGEGADFRAPLGVAVIGGVITSTLLTLLVVPTLYDAISSVWEWTWRRVRPLFLASDAGAAVGR
jgi:HAE1 family hydrophobic/amphiphilic exporter-1